MNERRFSGKNLHQWVKNLPIGHLQLSGRPANLRRVSSTIGELFDAVHRGALLRSSPTAVARIKRTLNALTKALNRGNGSEGWDLYRKARPPLRSYKAIYFASPRLSRLAAGEQRSRLARMHLSRRAINALKKARIITLGQLINRAQAGIVGLTGLGQFKGLEIVASLDALSEAAGMKGSIDWVKFAKIRGFAVLPEQQSQPTPEEFICCFPSLCQRAVSTSFTTNALAILNTRLLRRAEQAAPRPTLGKRLGQNRETVRLHENEIVEALRRAIWEEDYCNCRFRFRQEFLIPLHSLGQALHDSPRRTWSRALRKVWGVDRHAIQRQEVLLLRLLGKDNQWALHGTVLEKRVQLEVQRFIRANRTREFSAAELWKYLRPKFKTGAPSLPDVASLLRTVPTLQYVNESDSFNVRLGELSLTDRCEVILRARGQPMHIQELTVTLAETAAGRKRRTAQDTVALLWPSARFVAIGKSGYWALPEWKNVETRTIADVAVDLLTSIGKPLHVDELFALIEKRRPAARISMGTVLRQDPRFVRVARATWTLKKHAAQGAH
jgi:DNA-directed RNA polymerase delta subunit